MRTFWPAALAALLLAGCASSPGIPDTLYFRLADPVGVPAPGADRLDAPLVIETLLADGVHSDQAILYSTDPDGDRLKAYHYQLWVDPPTRMLQRRLIRYLDQAAIAPLVVDRLPPKGDQYRLQLRLEAFERVRTASGWVVRVGFEARLDQPGHALPRLNKRYAQELPADDGIRASVAAQAVALDMLYAQLATDLVAAGQPPAP